MKSILLTVLILAHLVSASKILGLFPHPGISHFNVFKPILLALAEKGHRLEVASYFPNAAPVSNYKDLPFRGQNILTGTTDLKKFAKASILDYFTTFLELKQRGEDYCRTALQSAVIDEILASHADEPFDLILTEFYNSDCMLGLAHLLNVPFIGLTSCTLSPWHYKRVGAVEVVRGRTFIERWADWWCHKIVELAYRFVQLTDNRLLAVRFGAGRIADVGEIAKNTSLILVNQHLTLTGATQSLPRLVEIGGVHLQKAKPLPEDIKHVLDSSEVAYVSWGSKMRMATLPVAKRDAIIAACTQQNLTILWKWDSDAEIPDLGENVRIRKWLPQQDILCHKNVKVFFSHGGMLGVLEAVHCGVPLVVTPLYRDQFINAAAVEERGIGVVLPFPEMVDGVFNALKAALQPEVLKNAQHASHNFNSSTSGRNRPIDVAVWNIEQVISTKGTHFLRSRDDDSAMSTSDEIFLANAVIFAAVCYLIVKAMSNLYLKIAIGSRKRNEKID